MRGRGVRITVGSLLLTAVFGCGLFCGTLAGMMDTRLSGHQPVQVLPACCPTCSRTRSIRELLPVFSWLVLFGRCKDCKTPIPVLYPMLECVTGALFAATYLFIPDWPARACWWVFWLLLMAVVCSDVTSMRVPNVLSVNGACLMYGLVVLTGVRTWWEGALGAVVCYLLLLALNLFSGGKMGMGDVKLYLAIGVMLGPLHGIESLVAASFAGSLTGGVMRLTGLLERRQYMPFVPYIVIGVVIVVFFGNALESWYFSHMLGTSRG